MAFTGILFRRGLKSSFGSNPPRQGEIVFATDTYELGMLKQEGGVKWKAFDQFTDADLAKLNTIQDNANYYVLPTASSTIKGGVREGNGVSIDGSGYITVDYDGHGHSIATITNLQSTLDAKQDELSSGTNIKTINGESILGSGDITTVPEETLTSLDFENGTLTYTDELGNSTTINVLSTAVTSLNGETGDVTLTSEDILPDVTGQQGKVLTNDGAEVKWTDETDSTLHMYATYRTNTINPTAQTSYITTYYSTNDVHVYVNGVKLIRDVDFTANDGTTILFNEPVTSDDNIEVNYLAIDDVTKVYSKDEIDTIISPLIEGEKLFVTADKHLIDSFETNDYRAGEYQMLFGALEGYQHVKTTVMHDNVDPFMTTLYDTGTNLGTITSEINSGAFEVYFTSTYPNTSVQWYRKLITNNGKYDIIIPEDLMTGSGIIDLMNDDEVIDLDFTFVQGDLLTGTEVIDLQVGNPVAIDLD